MILTYLTAKSRAKIEIGIEPKPKSETAYGNLIMQNLMHRRNQPIIFVTKLLFS